MEQKFCHTYLSVDCVILGFDNEELKILLVKREVEKNDIKNLKLPGSLIYEHEDVDEAASRVLFELTGIKEMPLKQFRCIATPGRANNPEDIKWLDRVYHPNIDRIITVAYIALCKVGRKLNNTSRYNTQWCPLKKLPLMPFDHNRIVYESLSEIRKWVETEPVIIFEVLSSKFTISQLHKLYEAIYNKKIDIRNFHKKVAAMSYVNALDEKEKGVAHRAARYYNFNKKAYNKLKRNI